MHTTRLLTPSLIAAALVTATAAYAAFPQTALKAVCLQQIHSPTTIAHAGDGSGRLFVCDQPGKIWIIQNGMLLPTPFLNIASPTNTPPNNGPGPVLPFGVTYDERGLLGLAFHPGYANPLSPGYRRFYVNYSKAYVAGVDPGPPVADHTPNHVSVIAEFQASAVDPNVALPGSERRLLVFTQPQFNHNGGALEFGPDGYLYIGSGDGGSANDNNVGHTGGNGVNPRPTNCLGNAQDKTVILGKVLRIDPIDPDAGGPLTYSIPATNPFFNDLTPGIRKEIYAYGLRNPWKFSFDSGPGGTDRLFCGDVGQGRIEEINIIEIGKSYGWRYKEGLEFPTFSSGAAVNPMADPGGPHINPIAMYGHSMPPNYTPTTGLPELGLSVTGGYVYRGAAIPALQGKYIFGDYGSTSVATVWDGRMMGLEETAPLSGVFTLTPAIPFLGTANPVPGRRVLCLGEDESREVYIGIKTNAGVLQLDGGLPAGGIYKIIPVVSTTVSVNAVQDNTIFSEDAGGVSNTSDALGYLYAGRTGIAYTAFLRRALIAFDLAGQVPAAAAIQSATVKLFQTRGGPNSSGSTLALHRLTETWGEGTSKNPTDQGYGDDATANDATWTRRFFNTSAWATPGGSFVATASATASAPGSGPTTWASTPALVADVLSWVATPASNAGWILRGDEANDGTAVQFHSKESSGLPPALEISYDIPLPLTRREEWLRTQFTSGRFLVGQFVNDLADADGDTSVELLEYAYGFSPFDPQPSTAGLEVTATYVAPDTVCTITFRRDPRATDLSYYLESGSDLAGWTIITQSLAGADPTGTNFSFETPIPGQEPIALVQADVTIPAPSQHFFRLRVVRQP